MDGDGRQSGNNGKALSETSAALMDCDGRSARTFKKKHEKSTGNGLLQPSARPQNGARGSPCYSGGNL